MIGLEIGYRYLKAVWTLPSGEVDAARTVASPWGAAGLQEREITHDDLGALRGPLAELFAQGPRRRRETTVVALPNRLVNVLFRDLDRFSDFTEEERAYTLWRLSQSLPTALQTGHSLAYQHVQTSPSEEARRFRLMVLVARGDLVEDLADILEDLGVEPLGFLPELLASVNTMAEQLESRPGLVSWIQMAASGTGLLLIDRGVPTFYRFTSWGVDQVIQRAAVHLGRSFEDVSATLQGGSLTRPTEVGGNEVAAVSDSIVPLLQEMQSTVQFHLRQAGRSDLTQVILSGGGAKLPGMESLLGSVLQAPCSTLDTLLVGLGLPQGDEGRYAACLGAVKALEGRAP